MTGAGPAPHMRCMNTDLQNTPAPAPGNRPVTDEMYEAAGELARRYISSDPRLDIWRRYPDIAEDEDDATDTWACGEVSTEFAVYARALGWDAEVIEVLALNPWADVHVWVELRRDGETLAMDWTARQYHNLLAVSRDPAVLGAPWPLVWNPATTPDSHPFMGRFTALPRTPQPGKHTGGRAQASMSSLRF